jgi:VIT1/CCC1 family predicted Fe2+/Mn2+ transporter
MSKNKIQTEIQKLDGELSTIINALMIIACFFLVEIILLAIGLISFNVISVLGIMGAIIAFYTKFKSARLKARVLIMLESLNK